MDIRPLLPVRRGHVTIRPLSPADATAYASGTADPDVRAFAHLPESDYTPELVREQIESVITPGLAGGTLAVLAIADDDTEEFLGSVVLFDITTDRAEVGFWLTPHARGRGAAQRAVECAVELGTRIRIRELRARTVSDNTASSHTLTRAGFVPSGHPELGETPSGEHALMQHYSRLL